MVFLSWNVVGGVGLQCAGNEHLALLPHLLPAPRGECTEKEWRKCTAHRRARPSASPPATAPGGKSAGPRTALHAAAAATAPARAPLSHSVLEALGLRSRSERMREGGGRRAAGAGAEPRRGSSAETAAPKVFARGSGAGLRDAGSGTAAARCAAALRDALGQAWKFSPSTPS